MKRWIILAAAVLMQMCLGATYSWSTYVQPLRALTGLLQGPAQLPFTCFYLVFPATMVVAGSLLPRLGPRKLAIIGGLVFGSGWLLASLGRYHYAFTVAGIGICGGIGVGLAYIVPIATCIQWFPKHKGLVTGVAVAGFGGGAAAISQAAGYLMGTSGFSPFATFALFGATFLVLVSLAGLAMEHPPHAASPADGSTSGLADGPADGSTSGLAAVPAASTLSWSRVVAQRGFLLLYLAMFAGLAAGFAVNANLRELYAGGTPQTGILAVSLFALANACGRVLWGLLFDHVRATSAIRANLLAQAAVLLAAPWLLRSPAGLLAFAVLVGFNYGGVLVIYASSTARIWGSEQVGQVYGWLFSANIPAALAPLVAGTLYDRWGTFMPALWGVATLLLLALAAIHFWRQAVEEVA